MIMVGHGGSEKRERTSGNGALPREPALFLPLCFLTAMSVASVLSNSTLAHVNPLHFWGPVTATLDWCEASHLRLTLISGPSSSPTTTGKLPVL